MRHSRLSIVPLAILFTCISLGGAIAGLDPEPRAWMDPDPAGDDRSESYRAGQLALDAEHWPEAVERFVEAASEGGGQADGALYWQAYALLKMNRNTQAMAVIDRLKSDHPESSWVDDAVALEIQAERLDLAVDEPSDDGDELKLLALTSLIHIDWERSKPILERYLSDDSSPRLAERALFVLSQSDSPEARQMLIDAAQNPANPELAEEAVHYLGYFDDQQTAGLLEEIYASNPNREVRTSVLEAMMIADDQEALMKAARSEPDLDLRQTAIEQLAILDALPALKELYAAETSIEVKDSILEAFMIADDKETLTAMARDEPEEELRATAIEMLGVLDATPELRQLYRVEESVELREQIAEAMMIADDTEALIEIATTDPDADVRHSAIEGLGLIDAPEAMQALTEIYAGSGDVETKLQIIEAFMLQDDATKLIEIARNETDPDLREEAIEALGLLDAPEAKQALYEIYDSSGDVETKLQIIEAFMLQDDAAKLIEIARNETDPELREEAIEALSYMDAEEASEFLLDILEEG